MSAMREALPTTADAESRVHDAHHESLRLWLRLLTCTLMIERRVRQRLRERFATTLPRFDLMAQLERAPDGLKMSELSRRMMVSGGNVTGITDQLVAEGMVERRPIEGDRRAYAVRLTAAGRGAFGEMAKEHERWIEDMMAALPRGERDRLHALLGELKASLRAYGGERPPRHAPKEQR
jgi:DNA-binding MarR family transcriptional regulator